MNYSQNCRNCGKIFYYTSAHRYRNPKYCSRLCCFIYNRYRFLEGGKKSRFSKGHTPWNKGLSSKTNALLRIISDKKRGRRRPDASIWMKNFLKNIWKNPILKQEMIRKQKEKFNNDNYLKIFFRGCLFPKTSISELTDLDKKVIEAKILLFKIRRSLNAN